MGTKPDVIDTRSMDVDGSLFESSVFLTEDVPNWIPGLKKGRKRPPKPKTPPRAPGRTRVRILISPSNKGSV